MTTLQEFLNANQAARQMLASELAGGGSSMNAFWYKLAVKLSTLPYGRFVDGHLIKNVEARGGNNFLACASIFVDKCASEGLLVTDFLSALRAAGLNLSAIHLQKAFEAK